MFDPSTPQTARPPSNRQTVSWKAARSRSLKIATSAKTVRWWTSSDGTVAPPDRQLRLAVAHDITRRKRTESMHATMYAISAVAHAASSLSVLLERIHHILAARIDTLAVFCRADNPTGWIYRVYDARGTAPAPQALDARHPRRLWYQQVLNKARRCSSLCQRPESGGLETLAITGWESPLPSGDRPLGVLALRGRPHESPRRGGPGIA